MKLNVDFYKARLVELGLTTYMVAMENNFVAHQAIYKWLKGGNMSAKSLKGLASILECSEEQLLLSGE